MWILPYLFFFSWAINGNSAPSSSDRVEILEVSGPRELKVIRGAGAREQLLKEGEMLFVGDELFTAKDQIASLIAYDGTKWKIAPSTRLKLEARKPEKQNFFYWVLQITSGSMWGKVPKGADGKDAFRLKVHTKSAALGIRGTEYLIRGGDELSNVDVLEGTVWWGTSLGFDVGTYKTVTAGQHAEVGADRKITVGASIPDKTALLVTYGLLPSAGIEGETENGKKSGSSEECLARGKGWKSNDGSKAGECVNE